jgi:hypothetical protein
VAPGGFAIPPQGSNALRLSPSFCNLHSFQSAPLSLPSLNSGRPPALYVLVAAPAFASTHALSQNQAHKIKQSSWLTSPSRLICPRS